MQRLEIPENCQKSIPSHQITLTSDELAEDRAERLAEYNRTWRDRRYRPLFDCPVCHEGCFVHPLYPDGKPDYNRVIACRYKGCYQDSFDAYLRGETLQTSGITGPRQTFATFNTSITGVQKAYTAAKKIADGEGDFLWLIIYGGVGNGKTHLLNAIANRVLDRGYRVKLIMMAELLSELRMSIESNQVDFKMKEMKEVSYLVIDELGLEYGTDWEKEKVEELLASRWSNGRFTVVATNRDIEELPPRIRSRFQDRHLSRWVKNEAGDYRNRYGSRSNQR